MSKLLNKIRGLFKEENQFIKDESLKAVHTWLLEDTQPKKKAPEQQPVRQQQGYQNYKQVSDQSKREEMEKIAGLLKGAKTNFTQQEFDDRKKEILGFLIDLKKQKSKK